MKEKQKKKKRREKKKKIYYYYYYYFESVWTYLTRHYKLIDTHNFITVMKMSKQSRQCPANRSRPGRPLSGLSCRDPTGVSKHWRVYHSSHSTSSPCVLRPPCGTSFGTTPGWSQVVKWANYAATSINGPTLKGKCYLNNSIHLLGGNVVLQIKPSHYLAGVGSKRSACFHKLIGFMKLLYCILLCFLSISFMKLIYYILPCFLSIGFMKLIDYILLCFLSSYPFSHYTTHN